MKGSAKFKTVPIIDVTKENVEVVGPAVRGAIIGADFIAIDCELSGLGNRKNLNASSIEERYLNTSNVAKTRSIISLGLSLFKLFKNDLQTSKEDEEVDFSFHVQTFNILTLCSEDYIVEPNSLKFLVGHGFDFCKQYAQGLPYFRGRDQTPPGEDFVRQVFLEIVRHQKPIVLHNGFIDLVFLYQNLYAQLPQTVHSFAADLAEMFPNGIYDSKYLSDYVCRKPSSFLEYVFRSQQRKNIVIANAGNAPYVQLVFPSYDKSNSHVEYRSCDYTGLFQKWPQDLEIKCCSSFANHGHCTSGKSCPLSHDIDLVVLSKDANPIINSRKRKLGVARKDGVVEATNQIFNESGGKTSEMNCGGHRAGYDAFMTGFSFATFLVHSVQTSQTGSDTASSLLLANTAPEFSDPNIVNRIYLVCKDIPFMIRKSAFSHNSVGHSEKYAILSK